MTSLYLENGIAVAEKGCVDEGAEFVVRKITASDLIQEGIVSLSDAQIREELLKNWDCEEVYDKEIRDVLEERFSFVYPYDYLREMPVKVSVSELKKRSRQGEMEKEEALFYEPDIVPLIPPFIAGKEEAYTGAARGTAYHRLMECLDYTHADSVGEIREQIQKLVEEGKMTKEESASIYLKDILGFTRCGLGKRMGKAAGEKMLFREQPFVISVKMREIRPEWTGEETVLVQGIIDAYFLEGEEIVLVDYKTDRVEPGAEETLINLYHSQLEDYARALERMAEKESERMLYLFLCS